jgi:hypothetical protein
MPWEAVHDCDSLSRSTTYFWLKKRVIAPSKALASLHIGVLSSVRHSATGNPVQPRRAISNLFPLSVAIANEFPYHGITLVVIPYLLLISSE